MNKIVIMVSFLVLNLMGCGWTTVGPGEAGIKFSKAGSGKGLDDMTLTSGWVFSGPTTEVIVFPTTVQTVTWTSDLNEGSSQNEELTFQAKQGETFHADVSLSFRVDRKNVVDLYREFRMDDLEILADRFIRTRVRDALNRTSIEYTADMLAGPGRPQLQDRVKALLEKDLGEHGITVTELSFNGEFRYPATRQIQQARAAENKVRTMEMEAKQRVAKADGEAQEKVIRAKASAQAQELEAQGWANANLIEAQGYADALKIKLKAEQSYNNMVNRTVTSRVIQAEQVKKWNGVMPRVMATPGGKGSSILLNVPAN
jgi:regulator of protease activity HflC (stomatin/prohibitin superfamily)